MAAVAKRLRELSHKEGDPRNLLQICSAAEEHGRDEEGSGGGGEGGGAESLGAGGGLHRRRQLAWNGRRNGNETE